MARITVVLFNLGGPDRLDSVVPFLRNLFTDPYIIELPYPIRLMLGWWIARRRAVAATQIYARLGGASPLLLNTQEQAKALSARLTDWQDGNEYCVEIAMRYWKPFIKDTFRNVLKQNPDYVVLIPLYPQYSRSTTGSSLRIWDQHCAKHRPNWREVRLCCYPDDENWIAAIVEKIHAIWPDAKEGPFRLLFSAHGLPESMQLKGDPYRSQIEKTCRRVVESLPENIDTVVCFQSRVGSMPWLRPYTEDEIIRAGADGIGVIVVPIAFVSEHSETLIELDQEYHELAVQSGVSWYLRTQTVGASSPYIDSLVGLVDQAVTKLRRNEIGWICPARICEADRIRCPIRMNG